jgi:hypothetical protein
MWSKMYVGLLHVQYLSSCTVPLFMYSTGYYCQILMKLEFYRQIFEKYVSIKCHDNPSSGSRVAPRGQTHRQI